jgi:hypothetical protein
VATSITLRNQIRRVVTLHVPELGRQRHEIGTNDRDKATGQVGLRVVIQHLPTTLTLLARGSDGDTIAGLPPEVERSQEVQWAKARGDIAVERIETTDPAPASPVAPIEPAVMPEEE